MSLLYFVLQPVLVPLALLKAVAVIRHRLSKVPQQSRHADATAVAAVASVCRHWREAVVGKNSCIRPQLIRFLGCECSF